MSGKSGKSLELAYLSGKSLEFEENCPELSLVNFLEHETFILVFEIVKEILLASLAIKLFSPLK